MKLNLLDIKEITDFEKELPVELIVNERPSHYKIVYLDANGDEQQEQLTLPKYYASFEYTEIKKGRLLEGAYGNGETIKEAIIDYCKMIENQLLVINAYSSNRLEIRAPKLEHTIT